MSFQFRITGEPMNHETIAALDLAEEQDAPEVAARDDTLTLTIKDASGKLIGYAVFGKDEGDMLAIYYARAMVPLLGAALMRQFFGASKIMGTPLRMHVSSVRDIAAKARMFGSTFAVEGVDADGIMQGVFR